MDERQFQRNLMHKDLEWAHICNRLLVLGIFAKRSIRWCIWELYKISSTYQSRRTSRVGTLVKRLEPNKVGGSDVPTYHLNSAQQGRRYYYLALSNMNIFSKQEVCLELKRAMVLFPTPFLWILVQFPGMALCPCPVYSCY